MSNLHKPRSRENELVVQELKGEILIYDLQINKAFCLNETSALIWQFCDGNKTVSEISRELSRKLKQPTTEDLIWLALDQLKEDNLLSDRNEIEINFNGLSRREVIRKVGLASMIALPVISSLIAPIASQAASGTSCISNGSSIPSCATSMSINCCLNNSSSLCCSGICRVGSISSSTCVSCLPNGVFCASSSQCCSSNCGGSVCV